MTDQPPSNGNAIMTARKKRKPPKWQCDVCQDAVFPTYDEAAEHERHCQGKRPRKSDAGEIAVDTHNDSKKTQDGGSETSETLPVAASSTATEGAATTTDPSATPESSVSSNTPASSTAPAASASIPVPVALESNTSTATNGTGPFPKTTAASSTKPTITVAEGSAAWNGNWKEEWQCAHCQRQIEGGYNNVLEHERKCKEEQIANTKKLEEEKAAGAMATSKPAPTSTPAEAPQSKLERRRSSISKQAPFYNKTQWKCDYCDQVFGSFKMADDHEKTCPSNNEKKDNDSNEPERWQCEFCKTAIFDKYDDAVEHEEQCEAKPPKSRHTVIGSDGTLSLKCSRCGEILENSEAVKKHRILCQTSSVRLTRFSPFWNRTSWKCDFCPEFFGSYQDASEHEKCCDGRKSGDNKLVRDPEGQKGTSNTSTENGNTADLPEGRDEVSQKNSQSNIPPKTALSKGSSFLLYAFILIAGIALSVLKDSLPAATIVSTRSIMALGIFVLLSACGSFGFALFATHQGTHHHQAQGFFSEIATTARDAFGQPMLTTNPIENDAPSPTLKEYLSHPDGFHMAFAPAFFGFFAYFGALAAMEEETGGRVVPTLPTFMANGESAGNETPANESSPSVTCGLKSVAGASAGAMAAVMLAAGIQPRRAAEFSSTFSWRMVADPIGIGGVVKGNKFEKIMREFLMDAARIKRDPPSAMDATNLAAPVQLEESLVPVAVSGFDLFRMKGKLLSRGCMAKASRSSAGFPGLFQPVAWRDCSNGDKDTVKSILPDSLLIDGGITDGLGLLGLSAFSSDSPFVQKKRIINVVVGDFGAKGPSGIKDMPKGVHAESLVSVAIVNTPMCGPWAMENGPIAVESARKAMIEAIDKPMQRIDTNHYLVRVDASKWVKQ